MSADSNPESEPQPQDRGPQSALAARDGAADGLLPRVSDTGAAIGGLPSGTDAPDSLNEMVNPAASSDPDVPLRVSTILGPLPGRVTVQKTRDLNDAVHGILIVGLVISTALLAIGLLLALLRGEPLPTAMLAPGAAIQACLALQAAGFLSLGLIVLLLTPIVRVIGSVVVFVWERDWVYTAVTLTVLVVMVISIIVGRG